MDNRGRKKKSIDSDFPFAKRLRSLLEEQNITQLVLAKAIGVSRQSVGQWENGKTIPDILDLKKISIFFGVSADYLTGVDNMEITGLLDSKAIGQRIKELRKKNALTQSDFGEILGKSLRTVQKYEKGEIALPISVANDIAQLFGVLPSYIFNGDCNCSNPEKSVDEGNSIICPYCNKKLHICVKEQK